MGQAIIIASIFEVTGAVTLGAGVRLPATLNDMELDVVPKSGCMQYASVLFGRKPPALDFLAH